jgi:hypothetical protein
MVQPTQSVVQFSLEWRKGLRCGIERIAFGQNQESAIAIAAQKDEAESGHVFSLPTLSGESLHDRSHRAAQVGGGFEPFGFDDFPLQVKENDVPRRIGAGVDVVVISGHRGSFASGSGRVYSVVARTGYCIRMRRRGISKQPRENLSIHLTVSNRPVLAGCMNDQKQAL